MCGQACLPAAKLALEDVNRNEDILRDYHINLADKDDEVSCIHGIMGRRFPDNFLFFRPYLDV